MHCIITGAAFDSLLTLEPTALTCKAATFPRVGAAALLFSLEDQLHPRLQGRDWLGFVELATSEAQGKAAFAGQLYQGRLVENLPLELVALSGRIGHAHGKLRSA